MRTPTLLLSAILSGCLAAPQRSQPAADPRLAAAEALIDAFYSFDPAPLRSALAAAPASAPEILYYQGWAQGGNYVVLNRRPCRVEQANEVSCAITVRDDLIAALGTGRDVTDTFHLSFEEGRIVRVRTTSDDPPEFAQALQQLRRDCPELLTTGACRGFFDGGPTPGDCVREVVRSFADFASRRRN